YGWRGFVAGTPGRAYDRWSAISPGGAPVRLTRFRHRPHGFRVRVGSLATPRSRCICIYGWGFVPEHRWRAVLERGDAECYRRQLLSPTRTLSELRGG